VTFTVFGIFFISCLVALSISIGFFSPKRKRAYAAAAVLAVVGMLGACFRLWWFNIPDRSGRTISDLSLQVELVLAIVLVALACAWLAHVGYRIRKHHIAKNA
jgi:fatty acid desaturase